MFTTCRLALSLLALSTLSASAQQVVQRLDAVDHAERQKRIAIVGDLGLPPLLPLLPDSPRDTMYYADRQPVPQGPSLASTEGGPGQMFDGFLPPGPGGTGTDKSEMFKYQVPGSYDPGGPPVPMVIAYHGFGASAGSVALSSTIDEEANARGWFYVAPTGIDDVLFGSPVCQQNVEAAIQWVMDNFNVDPDRLYMVGFSMGGGVSANFVARRRDPDGMMIAALGIVSGTFDWTLLWSISLPPGKAILENPYNFGGKPFGFPFEYQRSSTLHFISDTYPPLPGVLDITRSMGLNLGSVPTYVTWDVADTLPEVLSEEPVFVGLMAGLGGTFVSKPVSGTPEPTHSWAVLDEADLFEFFEGKSVDRTPDVFEALLDKTASVSWAEVTQRFIGTFSRVTGVAVPAARTLSAQNVLNAKVLATQVELAGITGPADVHVAVSSDDGFGFNLQINDLSAPPAWLEDPATSALLPGTESDPFAEGLITHVEEFGSLAVDLVTNADYIANLSSAPEPAQLGEPIAIHIDGPSTATAVYMLIGANQAVTTFKGNHKLLVKLGPTTQIVALVLGPGGQITLQGSIPNEPQLSGAEVLLQGILTSGSSVNSMSNLWVMDID
jgi:pimeloyl-ACP methyl ester carboxylesterase